MNEKSKARNDAMRRMRSRERRYRRLLQTLPAAVLVVSRGRIRYANRAAAHLLGATLPTELQGVPYSDFVLSAFPIAARGSEGQKLRRLDGEIIEVEASVQPSGGAELIMLRDVTAADAMDTERQLGQAQRMEAVGRLASGIAHDFNNLLTAIHGHAQFLIEDLPAKNPSRADAEEILRSAERAAALTRQLLAFSRGRTLSPQTLDLNQVVSSMEQLLRRVIAENITLTTALDTTLWPVRADAGHIEQILVNLVVNARDAMPNGGTISIKTANVELDHPSVRQRAEVEPGPYVMLAVTDSGIGMDRETQSHIFEPFFTTKDHGKGTGLGLSTVYGIVKQSGGHVFVYSEPGKGTSFKIYFPATEQISRARAPKAGDTFGGRGETILVVDDDAAVRDLTKRILEARGYHVISAGSGTEAEQVLEGQGARLSLLITDVVLPDTSARLLVESLAGSIRGGRVLLMSGYTAEDVRRQGDLPAGTEFIEKPFTPNALAQKVREILDAGG
ncbi:MAG: ATP-binding protein [Gemmatimonadota bacterium]